MTGPSPTVPPDRDSEVLMLEEVLGVRFPLSYRRFLIDKGAGSANGLPVLGLPALPIPDSVWGATEVLRRARPDLGPGYLAIRFMDSRALCLRLAEPIAAANEGSGSRPPEDALLSEVELESRSAPRDLGCTFAQYLSRTKDTESLFQRLLGEVSAHLQRNEQRGLRYSHAGRPARQRDGTPWETVPPPYRAHHWRIMRSCVRDYVVGICVVHHSEAFGGLEVRVFLTTDHPAYERGHGARALASLLLADAYRNGASLEIRFTRQVHGASPISFAVPFELQRLANSYGLSFSRAADGVISHQEAMELYGRLVGLSDAALAKAQQLQARGTLSMEGLCYLISSRIWTLEEATWILLNAPEPERTLFGVDLAENRLDYSDSVSFGRAALAATRLCHKLHGGDDESEGSSAVKFEGPVWVVSPDENVELDWLPGSGKLALARRQAVAVLPRPRRPLPDEAERLLVDCQTLSSAGHLPDRRFLLCSQDLAAAKLDLQGIAAKARRDFKVDLLVLPFSCLELDEEVERRMARARVLRR